MTSDETAATSNDPPVLAYAVPIELKTDETGWANGRLVIAAVRGTLPMRCIRCGEEADTRITQTQSWHSPWVYLCLLPVLTLVLLMPGILLYGIVAACMQRKVVLKIGLCETHWLQRRRARRMMTMLVATGSLLMCLGIYLLTQLKGSDSPALGVTVLTTGAVTVFVSYSYFDRSTRLLRAVKVDARHAWLKGANPAFLAQLPSI